MKGVRAKPTCRRIAVLTCALVLAWTAYPAFSHGFDKYDNLASYSAALLWKTELFMIELSDLLDARPQMADFFSNQGLRAPGESASLELGVPVETTFGKKDSESQWFKVDILREGNFKIVATARDHSEADPAIKLYEKSDQENCLKELKRNDRVGRNFDAAIETTLDKGEYWLRLFDLSGRGGRVQMEVNYVSFELSS